MNLSENSVNSTILTGIFFFLTLIYVHAFQTEVLENGLEIIVKENHTAPIVALRIYVKTGSMYEQEYLGTGISHYFEHLISGGSTANRSEQEIKLLIDRLGGVSNAYTTKDHTCYYITTSSDMAGDAIELMADWMINSTFPESEVKREKGVVLEELKKGREEPHRIVNKLLYETMFTKNPVQYPTIGYENLIQSVTRDDILQYYRRMYAPNNMVFVAVGDFDKNNIFMHVRKAFENFERRTIPAISLPNEPPQLNKKSRTIIKPGLGEAYLTIAFHTVTIFDDDMYPLDVLSYALSRGRSSRFVRLLREEKRLVSSINTYSYTPEYDAGIFGISITCKNENVEPTIDAVLDEIRSMQQESITEEELQKVIKQKIADDILGNQTAEAEASMLGINMITTGNPEFNSVYLDGIKRVTSEDVQRVSKKYLRDRNMTVVVLRPEAPSIDASDGPSKFSSDPLELTLLDNGLRLIVKRNRNIPLVNIQALFLGGVLYETQGQAGICGITAELLTRGNDSMTRDEIAEAFDKIGGTFSGSSGNNTFSLTAEVLKEDFDTALAIFAESIQTSSFPIEEFETVKLNRLSAIKRRNDRWDSEITNLFRQHFFKDHPYGHDNLGTIDSVSALTIESVKRYYQEFVTPDRGVITVFGDIEPEKVRTAVAEAFRDFNSGSTPLPLVKSPEAPSENKVILKKVPKNLAAVFVGYPGIRVTNLEDRFPLTVLDTIISGYSYPGGWLHEHLRGGDKDYVYVVHAFNFMGLDPGYFGVMAASSPEKMDDVVEIILRDINKIRTDLVTEEELAKAKIICITAEKLSRQTNADMALLSAIDELYGLGYNFSEQFTEKINAVTVDDVLRVAKKYLTNHVIVRTVPDMPGPAATVQ